MTYKKNQPVLSLTGIEEDVESYIKSEHFKKLPLDQQNNFIGNYYSNKKPTNMNQLIKITDHKGQKVVSARELYKFLGISRDFTTWCKKMFEYGFVEGADFTPVLGESTGGRPPIDYALTLDCAKEISMIQRSEKGKQARQYFIACEKSLKEIAQKPISTLDLLELSIKQLREQDQRMSNIENDMLELKAKTNTQPDYFTVVGYATLNNIKIGLHTAAKLGGKASRLCRKHGYHMEETPDPRFGKVKMYPKSILQEVFNDPI